MGEVGLAKRHATGVKITPDEEKQERDGGVVFVGNGVDDCGSEINSQENLSVRNPASFVFVFFCDEGVFLAFDFEFWCACEFGFFADDRFKDGLCVADGDADADSHDERHVEECLPPGFRADFFLCDQVEAGDGASGSEEERQIDDEHLEPTLIEANDHDRKKRD